MKDIPSIYTRPKKGQEEYWQAIQNNDVIIALGLAGTGKAQPLSSKIRIPGGWTTMGEIDVNDIITSANGKQSKVIAIHPQGEKDIYKITFNDGSSVECCNEHLWSVYCYNFGNIKSNKKITHYPNKCTRILNTGQINTLLKVKSNKDRLYIPLNISEQIDDIYLPLDPYLLGTLIGDGGLTNYVGFTTSDQELVEILQPIIKNKSNNYILRKDTEKYAYRITEGRTGGKRNIFKEELKLLGLFGKKSKVKFIPKIYLESSHKQRISLLQGLLDTDGSVDKGSSIQFYTTSDQLSLDVQYLVRSIGGLCKIKRKYTNYKGQKVPSWSLSIRYHDQKALFQLSRKKDRCNENYQYKDYLRKKIEKIEYIGKKEAKCITIDSKDQLYITDNFIVTHNSYLAIREGLRQVLDNKTDYEKIVFIRGLNASFEYEKIGAVPGFLDEKLAPYIQNIRDSLEDCIKEPEILERLIKTKFEFQCLSTCRGRSFNKKWIIYDEAQSTSTNGEALKMVFSRLGKGSKLIITADPTQTSISPEKSDLLKAIKIVKNVPRVAIITMNDIETIQRHQVVKDILMAYEKYKNG